MSSATRVRKSLLASTEIAIAWLAQWPVKTRADYDQRGGLGDVGTGAVYVFGDARGKALYIGQTGVRIKDRGRFPTASHKEAPWWDMWKGLQFIQLESQADRFALEAMLILGLRPRYNNTPNPASFANATLI